MFATVWTYTSLSLISLTLHLLIEQAETKVAQVTTQHVTIDARLLHDLIVLHQFMNAFFQRVSVVDVLVIGIIKVSPVQSFHFLTVNRERSACPSHDCREISPKLTCVSIILMF